MSFTHAEIREIQDETDNTLWWLNMRSKIGSYIFIGFSLALIALTPFVILAIVQDILPNCHL